MVQDNKNKQAKKKPRHTKGSSTTLQRMIKIPQIISGSPSTEHRWYQWGEVSAQSPKDTPRQHPPQSVHPAAVCKKLIIMSPHVPWKFGDGRCVFVCFQSKMCRGNKKKDGALSCVLNFQHFQSLQFFHRPHCETTLSAICQHKTSPEKLQGSIKKDAHLWITYMHLFVISSFLKIKEDKSAIKWCSKAIQATTTV